MTPSFKIMTKAGCGVKNKKANSTCHVDCKLITGASPEAANDFGKLVAQQLLSFWNMDGHLTQSSPASDPQ